MKYVLYKFPDVIRRSPETYEPYIVKKKGVRRNKKGVPSEIVDVVYGDSIYDVTDELIHIIQDEMSMAYGCQSNVFGPDTWLEEIALMTSEPFDYEMHAVTVCYHADSSKEGSLYFGVKELPE